jgi:hypothetical protein
VRKRRMRRDVGTEKREAEEEEEVVVVRCSRSYRALPKQKKPGTQLIGASRLSCVVYSGPSSVSPALIADGHV